jgi:omega-6 fatty acid desaturase / acyl-lipid omega-6 desaturase (Delta-12 desaturase)
MDAFLLACIYKATITVEILINPKHLSLPNPILYGVAWYALWILYSFCAGLVATGLWVIAHECGHQAFSEKKWLNNTVGWILHSS